MPESALTATSPPPPRLSELSRSRSRRSEHASTTTNQPNLCMRIPCVVRVREKVRQFQSFFNHLSLYVGLIVYVAVGAWIFIAIEHPVEKDKMSSMSLYLSEERAHFLQLIYNVTSNGHEEDSDEVVRSVLLATNRVEQPRRSRIQQAVQQVDAALKEYERTVALAADEGIDMGDRSFEFKWTYVQSVFFAASIITTVGYGHIAPTTSSGRIFCIVFAIIGIPFMLTVIADVGQLSATLLSMAWDRLKPHLKPHVRQLRRVLRRLRHPSRLIKRLMGNMESLEHSMDGSSMESSTSASGMDTLEDQRDEADAVLDEAELKEDLMKDAMSAGITTNLIMAAGALGYFMIFLCIGAYFFTFYEEWSFVDSFYFCFITITTIGFGDLVPQITSDTTWYMLMCGVYILLGLAFTSTIIELVRRQYVESWKKVQELRAQIEAQLRLADHLRRMAEQGKELEGMDVDLEELRVNLSKFKEARFAKMFDDFDLANLEEWITRKAKVKAVTVFFYETSL